MNFLSGVLRISFLLCLLSLPWSVQAEEAGYDIKTEVYTDAQNQLTIATVAGVEFSPMTGDLKLGFQSPVTWLRMTIRPSRDVATQPLILRVGPYQVEKLTFFQKVDGQWKASLTGTQRLENLCLDDSFCFALEPLEQDKETVYLRVESPNFPVVKTELLAADALLVRSTQRLRFTQSSMAAAIALLAVGLLFIQVESSALLRCYCCFQAVVVLLSLLGNATMSRTFPACPPELLNLLFNAGLVIRSSLFSLGGWLLLAPHKTQPFYKKLFLAWSALTGIDLFMLLGGQAGTELLHIALQFSMPWLHLFGAATASGIHSGWRKKLLFGWSFYAFMLTVGYLNTFGWLARFPIFGSPQDLRLSGAPAGLFVLWMVFHEQKALRADKAKKLLQFELNAAKAKALEDKNIERGEMIDMLTHELKTPLATIKFALASAKRLFHKQAAPEDENMDFQLRAERIETSVNRMNALILQVAQSHRIELSAKSTIKKTIDARALLEETIQPYALTHRFEVDLEPGLQLRSDPLMLTAIIDNLINNACKYSVDQVVRLSATKTSYDFVQIMISNQVVIGTEPDPARVFSRYYRNPETSDIPGSGMGLHIAHNAAGKIGATLLYRKADGVVIFDLGLPC